MSAASLSAGPVIPAREDSVIANAPQNSEGDSITILDLPADFTIGIDTYAISAKEFTGFTDVSLGPHLIWVTPSATHAPRSGVWICCQGITSIPRIHMLRWCTEDEILKPATSSDVERKDQWLRQTEHKRLRAQDPLAQSPENVGPKGLGPKQEEAKQLWWKLTNYITPRVLDRVVGQTEGDWFVHTTDSVRGAPRMAAEVELDNYLPDSATAALHGKELTFTFPSNYSSFIETFVGDARTRNAVDATDFVRSLQPQTSNDPLNEMNRNDLFGEFQLAYLLGMHLGNENCVYQWQQILLKIMLRTFAATYLAPPLATDILGLFWAQIEHSVNHTETPLMAYDEAMARDIRVALTVYKKRFDEVGSNKQQETDPNNLLGTNPNKRQGTDRNTQQGTVPENSQDAKVSRILTLIEFLVSQPPLEWNLRSEETLRQGLATTDDGEQVQVELEELQDEDERGEYAPAVVDMDEYGRERGMISFGEAG